MVLVIVTIGTASAYGQSQDIPEWVKGVAGFWAEGKITDLEFTEAIEFLIDQNIISVTRTEPQEDQEMRSEIDTLRELNATMTETIGEMDREIWALKNRLANADMKPVEQSHILIPAGSFTPDVLAYDPYHAVVSAGSEIVWTNDDTVAHSVTSGKDPDGLFYSGLIDVGAEFSVTLDDAGEYPYFCALHPWLTGIITVNR